MQSNQLSNRFGPLIGAIDVGSTNVKVLIFAAKNAEVLTFSQVTCSVNVQKSGWVEQNPMELLHNTMKCVDEAVDNLCKLDIDPKGVIAVGITNQRDTMVMWDSKTGKPLYNAITWMDNRAEYMVENIIKRNRRYAAIFKSNTGLPLNSNSSGLKVKWLLENITEVQKSVKEGTCLFGTIDTWLIWNLTGGVNGGVHITDVTNASRTMLMNLSTLDWDLTVCNYLGIPKWILPTIRSSSEIYGYLTETTLRSVPISACIGDQQAALIGQLCMEKGQAKCSLGSGGFVLYNTGTSYIDSPSGLISTVAFKLGKHKPAHYALEGIIPPGGVLFKWILDNMGLVKDYSEMEKTARNTQSSLGISVVPTYTEDITNASISLPKESSKYYFTKQTTIDIVGLTSSTKSSHLIKAVFESVCMQIRDIVDIINKDIGRPLNKLLVDGGMSASNELLQTLTDICGIPIMRPLMMEATALGAAVAAGQAEGINVWDIDNLKTITFDVFLPTLPENENEIKYTEWKTCVSKCQNCPRSNTLQEETCDNLISSVPFSIFFLISFGLLVLAEKIQN